MFILALLQAHREALRAQRLSRAALEARQRERFRALVRHCARHSPYYREIMAERRIDPDRAEVEDFPLLDKHGVRENFDRIAADPAVRRSRVVDFVAASSDPTALMDGRFHVINTSATSGELAYFVFSESSPSATGRTAWRRRCALGPGAADAASWPSMV